MYGIDYSDRNVKILIDLAKVESEWVSDPALREIAETINSKFNGNKQSKQKAMKTFAQKYYSERLGITSVAARKLLDKPELSVRSTNIKSKIDRFKSVSAEEIEKALNMYIGMRDGVE